DLDLHRIYRRRLHPCLGSALIQYAISRRHRKPRYEAALVTIQDNSQPLVSIVVPAFNEGARIGNSIKKIDEYMRRSPSSCELVVGDDGSVDSAAGLVERSRVPRLRLIRNGTNHGKGYTVRQGVFAASGKYVLFTDADLSAPIEELDKLLDVAAKEKADVVI